MRHGGGCIQPVTFDRLPLREVPSDHKMLYPSSIKSTRRIQGSRPMKTNSLGLADIGLPKAKSCQGSLMLSVMRCPLRGELGMPLLCLQEGTTCSSATCAMGWRPPSTNVWVIPYRGACSPRQRAGREDCRPEGSVQAVGTVGQKPGPTSEKASPLQYSSPGTPHHSSFAGQGRGWGYTQILWWTT